MPVCEDTTCDRPGDWEAWRPDSSDTHRVCETHARTWQVAGWRATVAA